MKNKRSILGLDNEHRDLYESEIKTDAEVRRIPESEWIQLCAYFRQRGEEDGFMSMKDFADEMDISYTAMRKANSRYHAKIDHYIATRERVPKPRSVTAVEQKRGQLINTFRKGYVKHDISSRSKSENWFKGIQKDVLKGARKSTKEFKVGRIYAYRYEAKTKQQLPFWDMFPLMIYLGAHRAQNGNIVMNGLNLHYIPPRARQEFLEELLTLYSSTKSVSKTTRLMIDWASVKGMRGADLMIKSYLPQQFRSIATEVEPKEWINVIHMPLQRFVLGGGGGGKSFSANKVYSNY